MTSDNQNQDGGPRNRVQRRLVRVRGRDIVPKALKPIWEGVLYRGKVMILAGQPGEGKSAVTCDIVARITRGQTWPCSNSATTNGYAVLLTAEDDPEDTLRPRLDVAGADPDRYEVITGVHCARNGSGEAELDTVSLLADLPRIEALINETHAAILIVDPLTSFCASDTNKANEMRYLLDSLAGLARRTDACIVIVTHFNKRSDARRAMDLIAGSHVIVAAVRTAYIMARDPEDPGRRLMLPLKVNIAKDQGGYAFRIEDACHKVCGSIPRVVWDSERPAAISADEALVSQTPRARGRAAKSASVRDWLVSLMSDGPVPSEVLWRQAKEQGFSQAKVKEELNALGAVSGADGFQGPWFYRLPDPAKAAASLDRTSQP